MTYVSLFTLLRLCFGECTAGFRQCQTNLRYLSYQFLGKLLFVPSNGPISVKDWFVI